MITVLTSNFNVIFESSTMRIRGTHTELCAHVDVREVLLSIFLYRTAAKSSGARYPAEVDRVEGFVE